MDATRPGRGSGRPVDPAENRSAAVDGPTIGPVADAHAPRESSDPAPMPAEGDVIAGKYRIESTIGAGGMGKVFAARHLQLGHRVAIKVVRADVAGADHAERLLREARHAAGVESDHVVRTFDVGTLASGAPFVVMELLKGSDLGTRLRATGPLPVDEAVELVLQACEGLAGAHAMGIVHRDLKPDNLFVARRSDGSPLVKVLDFGISKGVAASTTDEQNLTGAGTMVGSPRYMAPEQIRDARSVDGRVDIWAMGVILYELVTGVTPFRGTTLPALCASIAADRPVPLRDLLATAPESLERIVSRCLEKEATRRFATVAELADALCAIEPAKTGERAHSAVQRADRIRGVLSSGAGTETMHGDTPAPAALATGSSPSAERVPTHPSLAAGSIDQDGPRFRSDLSEPRIPLHPARSRWIVAAIAAASLVAGAAALTRSQSGMVTDAPDASNGVAVSAALPLVPDDRAARPSVTSASSTTIAPSVVSQFAADAAAEASSHAIAPSPPSAAAKPAGRPALRSGAAPAPATTLDPLGDRK